MTNKKSSANLTDTIVSANVSTDGAKGAKVTTSEELWKGHEELINAEGVIVLTDELFRNLSADSARIYEYNGRQFRVLEKRSGTERGGKTLYKVQSEADTFTDFSIEELKQEFGCEYRRPKDGSSNCKTAYGKAKYATDKLSEVIAECNDEELTKAYQQLKGLVGLKRAEEQKREAEEREQREAAERAKKKSERADSHADDMTNKALIEQVAKRCGISYAEAKEMLGL